MSLHYHVKKIPGGNIRLAAPNWPTMYVNKFCDVCNGITFRKRGVCNECGTEYGD